MPTYLFTVQKALSLLPEGASVILNASSTASTAGTPAFSIYSATKAAVRSESPQLDTRPQRTQNSSQCG